MRNQIDTARSHEVLNASPVALTDFYEAKVLEFFQCFAKGRTIHAEFLGEIALGWQLVPSDVLAGQNEVAKLLRDFFGHALLLDRLQHTLPFRSGMLPVCGAFSYTFSAFGES